MLFGPGLSKRPSPSNSEGVMFGLEILEGLPNPKAVCSHLVLAWDTHSRGRASGCAKRSRKMGGGNRRDKRHLKWEMYPKKGEKENGVQRSPPREKNTDRCFVMGQIFGSERRVLGRLGPITEAATHKEVTVKEGGAVFGSPMIAVWDTDTDLTFAQSASLFSGSLPL